MGCACSKDGDADITEGEDDRPSRSGPLSASQGSIRDAQPAEPSPRSQAVPSSMPGSQGFKRLVKDCAICIEQSPADLFFDFGHAGHQATVCPTCIQRHAREEIRGKMEFQLSSAGVPVALLDQMGFNSVVEAMRADPNFIWCARPGCGYGQLHGGGDFMTCAKCRGLTCPRHRIPFHTGLTCSQYDEQLSQGNADQDAEWIQANTKQCPNCRHGIEKNEGCDHMTCRACRHEFCWRCLAPYKAIRADGNHRHASNCLYYRAFDRA